MGKFDNIVIASDMDGTYIARTEEGDRRNRERIEYFKANGGHFTFATGRNIRQLLEAVPDAGDIVNLPITCCNGAFLYDLGAKKELSAHTVDPYELSKMIDAFSAINNELGLGDTWRRKLITCKKKAFIENDIEEYTSPKFKSSMTDIFSMSEWEEYNIYKCVFVGEEASVNAMRPKLDPMFKDKFTISQANEQYYEYNAFGVSKASMLKEMLKLCFGERKMTLCVAGDYDNDAEMLKIADLACCPENASDAVKSICTKHFCHHTKGVIADIIDYIDKESR